MSESLDERPTKKRIKNILFLIQKKVDMNSEIHFGLKNVGPESDVKEMKRTIKVWHRAKVFAEDISKLESLLWAQRSN